MIVGWLINSVKQTLKNQCLQPRSDSWSLGPLKQILTKHLRLLRFHKLIIFPNSPLLKPRGLALPRNTEPPPALMKQNEWHCFSEQASLLRKKKDMTFICRLLSIFWLIGENVLPRPWVSLTCLFITQALLGKHWLRKPESPWSSARFGLPTRFVAAPVQLAQGSPCLSSALIPGEAEKIGDAQIGGDGGSSWDGSHLWDSASLGRKASGQSWRVCEDEQIRSGA